MLKEWFSPEDLAGYALPDMPATRKNINEIAERDGWRRADAEYPHNPRGFWRRREGRGGGYEYRMSVLPPRAQMALVSKLNAEAKAHRKAELQRDEDKANLHYAEAWRAYDAAPDRRKDRAKKQFAVLDTADAMICRGGMKRDLAHIYAANHHGVSLRSLYLWREKVAGLPKSQWLPALLPHWNTNIDKKAECAPEVWDAIKTDYLRLEQPSFKSCYRRVKAIAERENWTLPSERTLLRRIETEIPPAVLILAREGQEALKRKYPAQRRDRSNFHALEAVNADGHKFDVFVKTPDGRVIRPMMVAFQDLYSNKILSWRLTESENRSAVMLAFGDMVEAYGVPDACWLDNGRSFASKWLTGGTPNRFRFKVKEDDVPGVLTSLGVEVHWTLPYSGQSKPIERGFRDMCDDIAKHPRFAGAYTGNTVLAKPENYGSKAIEWDVFEATLAEGIAAHNAREGRRTAVCGGRLSFDQAFKASYEAATTVIRRATKEQRRLWLLAAEGVTVRADQNMIHLMGNRYWAEELVGLGGTKVVARFDPEALHLPLHVYRLDGSYIGEVPCIDDVGFASSDAARDHARSRKAWLKAQAVQLAAEKRMGLDDYVALQAKADAAEPVTPAVIRPVFGNLAVKAANETAPSMSEEERLAAFSRGVVALFPSATSAGE